MFLDRPVHGNCIFDGKAGSIARPQRLEYDNGDSPRWANKHNWLFYARFLPQDGPKSGKGTQVIWLDVDTGKKTRIAYGVSYFKETDCEDRWLYGPSRWTD